MRYKPEAGKFAESADDGEGDGQHGHGPVSRGTRIPRTSSKFGER